ncbi:hypothetical protein GCM10025858_13090 [Alicyclobacillus sacchari]|nr:hypothetical protein GCM10025858_13090 [Alicyclobacillus sacchari]
MKIRSVWFSTAGVAALLVGAVALPAHAAQRVANSVKGQSTVHGSSESVQPFQHIYVIMMENEGAQQILGNVNMPYVNELAQRDGYESNYFGVTHDSLANYVALLSGSNWGPTATTLRRLLITPTWSISSKRTTSLGKAIWRAFRMPGILATGITTLRLSAHRLARCTRTSTIRSC